MKFYPRLHWLRGFLSLSVVISHLGNLFPRGQVGDNTALIRCGTAAVPVFFVLSGFVMFKTVRNHPTGFKATLGYLAKRFLRIFPAYWCFLAITALYIANGGLTWDGAQSPHRDWAAGWALYSIQLPPSLPMAVSWSLFYEILFYSFLASFTINVRVGIVAMTVYFAASIVWDRLEIFPVFGLYPICLLFLGGMLLAAVERHRVKYFSLWYLFLFPGIALELLYVIGSVTLHQSVERLGAMLIVAGVLGLEYIAAPDLHVLVQKGLNILGNASFSLYVGHTITQSVLLKLMGTPRAFVELIVFVLVPVLVASVSYQLIEKPFMRFGKMLDSCLIPRSHERSA